MTRCKVHRCTGKAEVCKAHVDAMLLHRVTGKDPGDVVPIHCCTDASCNVPGCMGLGREARDAAIGPETMADAYSRQRDLSARICGREPEFDVADTMGPVGRGLLDMDGAGGSFVELDPIDPDQELDGPTEAEKQHLGPWWGRAAGTRGGAVDVVETARGSTGDIEVRYTVPLLDDEEELLAGVPDPRVCRVCQCTTERACSPSCYWAEVDLCSVCAELDTPLGRAAVGTVRAARELTVDLKARNLAEQELEQLKRKWEGLYTGTGRKRDRTGLILVTVLVVSILGVWGLLAWFLLAS